MLLFSFIIVIYTTCTCDMNDSTYLQKCKGRPIIITNNKTKQSITDKNNNLSPIKRENEQPPNNQIFIKGQVQEGVTNSASPVNRPPINSNDNITKGSDSTNSIGPQDTLNNNQDILIRQQPQKEQLQSKSQSYSEPQIPQDTSHSEIKKGISADDVTNDPSKTKTDSPSENMNKKCFDSETKGRQESESQNQKSEQLSQKDTRREKIRKNLFSDPLLNSISDILKPPADMDPQKENLKNHPLEVESQPVNLYHSEPVTNQTMYNVSNRPTTSNQKQSYSSDNQSMQLPMNIPTKDKDPISNQPYERPNIVVLPQPTEQVVQNQQLESEIKSKIRGMLRELKMNEQRSRNIAQCGLIVCDRDPLNYREQEYQRQPIVQPVIQPIFKPTMSRRENFDAFLPINFGDQNVDTIDTEHDYLRKQNRPDQIVNSQLSNCNEPVNSPGRVSYGDMNHLTHNHQNSRNKQNMDTQDILKPTRPDLGDGLKTDPCLFVKIFEEYSKGINFLSPKMKKEILQIKNDFMKQYKDELVYCKHDSTETKTVNYTTTRGMLDSIKDGLGIDQRNGSSGGGSNLFGNSGRLSFIKVPVNEETQKKLDGNLIFDTFEDEQALKEKIKQNENKKYQASGQSQNLEDQEQASSDDRDHIDAQVVENNINEYRKRPFAIKTVYLDENDTSDLKDRLTITKTVSFSRQMNPQMKKELDDQGGSQEVKSISRITASLSVVEKTVTVTETVKIPINTISKTEIENVPQTIKQLDFSHSQPNEKDKAKIKVQKEVGKKDQEEKKESGDTDMKDFFGILKQLEDVQPAEEQESSLKPVSTPFIMQSSETPDAVSVSKPSIMTIPLKQSISQQSQPSLSPIQIQSLDQSSVIQDKPPAVSLEKLNDIYSILVDMKEKIKIDREKTSFQTQEVHSTELQPQILDHVDTKTETTHVTSQKSEIVTLDRDSSNLNATISPINISLDSHSPISIPPVITSSDLTLEIPGPSTSSSIFYSSIPQVVPFSVTDSQTVTVIKTVEVNQVKSKTDLSKDAQIVDKSVSQNKIIQEIRNDQKDMIGVLQKIIHKKERANDPCSPEMSHEAKKGNSSGTAINSKPSPLSQIGRVMSDSPEKESTLENKESNVSNLNIKPADSPDKEEAISDKAASMDHSPEKESPYEKEKHPLNQKQHKSDDSDSEERAHANQTSPSDEITTTMGESKNTLENEYQNQGNANKPTERPSHEKTILNLPHEDIKKIKKKINNEKTESEEPLKKEENISNEDSPTSLRDSGTIAKLTVYPTTRHQKDDSNEKTDTGELLEKSENKIKIEIKDPPEKNKGH